MTEIIEKAKKGNKKAIEELYKSTCDELFYYCRQLCANEYDAQDLLHDTYLTAFEKLNLYRRDENFKGWLHTIALHKYYNKLRAEKPQLRADESCEIYMEEEEICIPQEYSERKELQKILMETISESLSDSQRITVILYYYDEKSVSEIAQELGCPEGTVKTRLYHSRKILRDEFLKRGITLGGSVVIISSVLKIQASTFSASAASTAAILGSLLGKSTASAAIKSLLVITKEKIIAGAAAVAVAGGAAAGVYNIAKNNTESRNSLKEESVVVTDAQTITEATTDKAPPVTVAAITEATTVTTVLTSVTSQTTVTTDTSVNAEPGGEPVKYIFDANNMEVYIPENYTPAEYFKGKNADGSYTFVESQIKNDIIMESREIFSQHVKSLLKFRPDTISGDEVIFMERTEQPEEIDISSELSVLYSNLEISEPKEFSIPADNTNSPESPTENPAQRYSFKAQGSTGAINGTAVIFRGNLTSTHIIVFADASGIRQQEYEDIISSISLSYVDNSWRYEYDIPEEFR